MAPTHQTRTHYRRQLIRDHLNRRAQRKEKEEARAKLYLDHPYHFDNADTATDGDNGTININKGGL